VAKIGVSIVGGTGYGAGELLRYLASHPKAEVVSVISSSKGGESVSSMHSHLRGFYDMPFSSKLSVDDFSDCEHVVVFAGLPHGVSAAEVPRLAETVAAVKGKVIDLSGDHRLRIQAEHAEFYGSSARDEDFAGKFAYGLTEINREQISGARLVANPGCLASACILAAAPFAGEVVGNIVFDAKTGISGAGRTPSDVTHLPLRHGSMQAYKVLNHRHEPEIAQALCDVSGTKPSTFFVPHLLPTTRGIYVGAYFEVSGDISQKEAEETLRSFYEASPFVRVENTPPELRNVVGTNFCDLQVIVRGRQVVVLGALDNLGKGMAGTAIQNMNIMCELSETTGLDTPSLGLV
jgi:N-acetyl-gamma-glutamyl-phosphate reductase